MAAFCNNDGNSIHEYLIDNNNTNNDNTNNHIDNNTTAILLELPDHASSVAGPCRICQALTFEGQHVHTDRCRFGAKVLIQLVFYRLSFLIRQLIRKACNHK